MYSHPSTPKIFAAHACQLLRRHYVNLVVNLLLSNVELLEFANHTLSNLALNYIPRLVTTETTGNGNFCSCKQWRVDPSRCINTLLP